MEENQKHTVSLGTVYDINKQIMLNQNSLSKHDLIIKRKEL